MTATANLKLNTTHKTRAEVIDLDCLAQNTTCGMPNTPCGSKSEGLARQPRDAKAAAIIGRDYTDLAMCGEHGRGAVAAGWCSDYASYDHMDFAGVWPS